MRITAKGRVTIPKAIRDRHGLHPGTDVEFVWNKNAVYLVRSEATPSEKLVLRMRGAATPGITTDEILAMTRGV